MGKAYKIAQARLQAWKISTQNMYKKGSKSCKNEQKCQKLQQKRQKTLQNHVKKNISTAVKN